MPTNQNQELPEDLSALEAALRQLKPLPAQLDRDRLMYLAGQASVQSSGHENITPNPIRAEQRPSHNGWRFATAAMTLLAVTLGGLLLHSQQAAEHIVYVEQPITEHSAQYTVATPVNTPYTSAANNTDYLQLRNLVLNHGIDALPTTPTVNRATSPKSEQPLMPFLQSKLYGNET